MKRSLEYVQWNLPEGAKARLGKGVCDRHRLFAGRGDHGGGKQRRRLALRRKDGR